MPATLSMNLTTKCIAELKNKFVPHAHLFLLHKIIKIYYSRIHAKAVLVVELL